jgi:hypothetical protein
MVTIKKRIEGVLLISHLCDTNEVQKWRNLEESNMRKKTSRRKVLRKARSVT